MCKFCNQHSSVKSHRTFRTAAVGLLIFSLAVSIHLFVIHFTYWWLPLVVVLAPAHAIVISGIAWLITRRRHKPHDSAGAIAGHSHVLHNPRAYDWLARIITLGGEAKFRRRTVNLAELQPGDAVLDVGCGTGTLLINAAKAVGPSGSAHGVDASAEMLARARQKAATEGINVEFHEASSDCLPFPNASCDVVFCTLMLHHLPAAMQIATIEEIRRVTRPGGRIVIVDMQRIRKISAVFSRMGIVHAFRSSAALPDWRKIEEILAQHGVQLTARRPVWGETICALVGRITAEV